MKNRGTSPGGGIGRHTGLKILCSLERAGSNPALGTNMSLIDTDVNKKKRDQAHRLLAELFEVTLRRGFFGTAHFRIEIQDGTIQSMKCGTERQFK